MKVIFISGYTEDAFRQRLDSDSDIDFLPKPFSLKQLAAKVRDVIAAGRLHSGPSSLIAPCLEQKVQYLFGPRCMPRSAVE